MPDRPKRQRRWFPWLAALGVALLLLSLMCVSALYGWFGWTFFLFVFLIFTLPIGTLAFLIAGIGAMTRRKWAEEEDTRRWPTTAFLVSVTTYLVAGMAFVSAFVVMDFEVKALERAAARAVPLCDAIQNYVRDRGAPPGSLEDLVPEWIDEVPSTTILACPDYRYDNAEERGDLPPTWSLRIECSQGPINWDQFLYYPDGNYTEAGLRWGGEHVARGDWVYVYE